MVPVGSGPPRRPGWIGCSPLAVRGGPGRCRASTAFWRSLRVVEVDHPRRDLAAHLGIEPVSSQERIGTRPTLPRIGNACQRPCVAVEEAHGGVAIRFVLLPAAAFLEDGVDRGAVDALQPELLADRSLTARPCTVARLHPGPRECLVVEDPELQQPFDRTVNECPVGNPRSGADVLPRSPTVGAPREIVPRLRARPGGRRPPHGVRAAPHATRASERPVQVARYRSVRSQEPTADPPRTPRATRPLKFLLPGSPLRSSGRGCDLRCPRRSAGST